MLYFRSLKDLIQNKCEEDQASSYNRGMESEAVESQLRHFLATTAGQEGIAAAYLFGSMARGTAGLGVLFSEEITLFREEFLLRLKELEMRLGIALQVVILSTVSTELIVRILQDSKLLLEVDRSKRVQFEVQSRNKYWDFEPVLRTYRSKNGLPIPSLIDLVQRDCLDCESRNSR
jgi:uncharacterized protein